MTITCSNMGTHREVKLPMGTMKLQAKALRHHSQKFTLQPVFMHEIGILKIDKVTPW